LIGSTGVCAASEAARTPTVRIGEYMRLAERSRTNQLSLVVNGVAQAPYVEGSGAPMGRVRRRRGSGGKPTAWMPAVGHPPGPCGRDLIPWQAKPRRPALRCHGDPSVREHRPRTTGRISATSVRTDVRWQPATVFSPEPDRRLRRPVSGSSTRAPTSASVRPHIGGRHATVPA